MPKNTKKSSPTVVRCRGCNVDLVKGSPSCVRVQVGRITGVEHGIEDFDETSDQWGYMHLKCFLLTVGDPRALEVMSAEAKAPTPAAAAT